MKEKLPVRRSSVEAGPKPAMELPEGWFVEEKPRPNSSSRPGRIDKTYVESSTGKTFRSMPAVEQYLEGKKSAVSSPKRPRRTPEKKPYMQIIPFTPRGSDFVLPDGWIVEANRRSSSDTVDKYYIEAETGKKFRSLLAVKRHLSEAGHEYASDNEPKSRRKSSFAVAVKGDKNEASISAVESRTPHSTYRSANFVLPDDWAVEKHTREKSHVIDKYYVEPETGRRFRSLVSVERHLNQKEDNELEMRLRDFKCPKKRRSPSSRSSSKSTTASEETSGQEVPDDLPEKSEENPTTPKEVSPDDDSGPLEQYSTPEKTETVEETEGPKDDFGSPPSSVNWVLTGPTGDTWNPQLDELVVPESTKQKWSEKFISTLNQENK